ncbi:MAG: nitroreductase [Oscillospiraceae bacterium]|nr:nitroreductase [Oscillospiraceae bacterium]
MEQLERIIRTRKSVRSYDGRPLSAEHLQRLKESMAAAANPWGVPVELRLLDAAEHGLKSPVVTGAQLYMAGKVKPGPHAAEAFGYSFEQVVLDAWALGVGTVWLGGTMDRPAFERAMALEDGEGMPCVSPVGYPAARPSVRETVMRKAIKADSRLDFGALFFEGDFTAPLSPERAGALALPLELVRWAPSAVNAQPWRVVVRGDGAYFYLKRSAGFSVGAVDMQRIDLGIALCHFERAARAAGLDPVLTLEPPALDAAGCEFVAGWRVQGVQG